MVTAAAEGRPWNCPTDIPTGTAPAAAPSQRTMCSSGVGGSGGMQRRGSTSAFANDDDWGWDDDNSGGVLNCSTSTPGGG